MFVTWKQTKNDQLRGCIGTFTPIELWSGLRKYSIVSAFQDRRFAPLQEKELPHLSVTVSLLGAFEDCQAWDDWKLETMVLNLRITQNIPLLFYLK